jgi:hypothetical protein
MWAIDPEIMVVDGAEKARYLANVAAVVAEITGGAHQQSGLRSEILCEWKRVGALWRSILVEPLSRLQAWDQQPAPVQVAVHSILYSIRERVKTESIAPSHGPCSLSACSLSACPGADAAQPALNTHSLLHSMP